MKRGLVCLLICILLVQPWPVLPPAQAASADLWWNEAWPYRLPVTVNGSGVAQAALNFSTLLNALGLNQGRLDVRSIRVVPYQGVNPGSPVAHAETYSVLLNDAEATTGWSLNSVNTNGGSLSTDAVRFSQGSRSVKAVIENRAGGYGYPGVEFHPSSITNWSAYETLLYDVWPEVNTSALDQAPDLYWFKVYNACGGSAVTQGGPPLALDRWNPVSVSLNPLGKCWPANGLNLSSITRLEFHTRDNVDGDTQGPNGWWDDGDVLTLWFDNLRLVDQDNGTIKWTADGSTTKFYIYFDVLTHEGHPQPALASLGTATLTATAGSPEAGGYYHQISGASTGSLSVWAAPTIEKIQQNMAAPVSSQPLRIYAARGEFEPFQIVVRSPTAQNLPVSVSNFAQGSNVIGGITIHRVDYVNITTAGDQFDRFGPWPDPLWPLNNGETVGFAASQNQPLWFTVQVPWDAAPGVYQAIVTIGSASIPVELQVWNFALPREIHLMSEWGFDWSRLVETVYRGTAGDWTCYWNVVDAFKQDFINHRLIPKGVGWPAGIHSGWFDCNSNTLDVGTTSNPWYFTYQGDKYVLAKYGFNGGYGFPAFLAFGPASNWPPDSRPSSFCSLSRGSDPPGNSAYNAKWQTYLGTLDSFIADPAHDYTKKAYAHIVNEPQTWSDYDIVAYLARMYKTAAPHLRLMVSEQVEARIYNNPTYGTAKIDIWMPTISNYEPVKSQDRQKNHNEEVWWYYLYGDNPPLPNPILMSHPGIEARITPWLAWAERVDGLLHYSTTDWSPNPWTTPNVTGQDNGDGFFFYPPRQDNSNLPSCGANGNRLVPSIRWENLRDGMEDYEYLWLLNGGDPQIGVRGTADALIESLVSSRTLFSRVPTDLAATRAAIAARLSGPQAAKTVDRSTVAQGQTLHYSLTYYAGDTAHTVTITDEVPTLTTVLGAAGSKSPAPLISGQWISWTVGVAAEETITLTITARADSLGYAVNKAQFTGPQTLSADARVLVYCCRIFMPLVSR